MRQIVKDLVSIIVDTMPIKEPIYEFGSLQVPGQEGFADLRPYFPNKGYIGADLCEGPGVDQILDLHGLDIPMQSVGTALCLDTLEHVERPYVALSEIHRVLHPNGIAVVSTVLNYTLHNYPGDYWRFSPEGLKLIMKPFPQLFIGYAGWEEFPHTVIGVGFKGHTPDLSEFKDRYEQWKKDNRYP